MPDPLDATFDEVPDLFAAGPREFARANNLPWSDTDRSADAAVAAAKGTV